MEVIPAAVEPEFIDSRGPESALVATKPAAVSVIPEAVKAALIVLPEHAKTAILKLPASLGVRIAGYLGPGLLALLGTAETPEEAAEMLRSVAQSAEADANAPVSIPFFTILHQTADGVAKKWVNPEGDTVGDTLYMVPLLWGPMRGLFVEGQKAPLCSAKGAGIGKGKAAIDANELLAAWYVSAKLIPDPDKAIGWCGKDHDCAKCWADAFGSDLKGGKGKACKEKFTTLFVLVKADENGELAVTDEGYGANISTKSMKPWSMHIDKNCRQRKVKGKKDPLSSIQAIHALKLAKGEGDFSYAVIVPELARPLMPDEFRKVSKMQPDAVKIFEQMGVEAGESYGGDEPEGGAGSEGMFAPEPDGKF